MSRQCPILYCHCAYAKTVPADVKEQVLERLAASGEPFEAVADLCEMSANRDPALKRLAQTKDQKIVACYPRAVKWLFHAADVELDEASTEVLNMRTDDADTIIESLFTPKDGE